MQNLSILSRIKNHILGASVWTVDKSLPPSIEDTQGSVRSRKIPRIIAAPEPSGLCLAARQATAV